MPWSNQDGNGRETGGLQQEPDLEELLKAKQRKLKQMVPGASDLPGRVALILAIVLAVTVASFAFTFRVTPDELGVVTRFGKVTRQEPAGLHFRLPYPIDEVHLPKVTRQNIIEIGMATRGGLSSMREGDMMLTGDENIVDVTLVVFWRIEDELEYLFNIRNPDTTVQEVAESAIREVVGQSDLQPILTVARQ
jgi:membrane protease subunit HflK